MKRRKVKKIKHDGFFKTLIAFIRATAALVAWPVNAVTEKIHSLWAEHIGEVTPHHKMAFRIGLGAGLVVLSFTLESWYHHKLWGCTVETLRAAGVAPFVDNIYTMFKLAEDS